MKRLKYWVYAILTLPFMVSCVKYDINPSPVAKISIAKSTYNVLEQVTVVNEGQGEYFSFWPGDKNHNYALRANGVDKGIIPNEGTNFTYSYMYTGTYNMVVVASSYDEDTHTRTEKVDSVKVTVVSGSSGNVIESIELYNCLTGYNSIGKMVGTDSILFPIASLNKINGISDSVYVKILNQRNFIYTASLFAEVYGDNNTLLTGMTDDTYQSNLIEPISYNPLVYKSRIASLKVVGQGGVSREYKMAAMFYPEMFTFSAKGKDAVRYSSSGLVQDADSANFISSYPDSCYIGLKIKTVETEFDAIPTFTATPGCTVSLIENGVEKVQKSGVSTVHFVKNQALYYKVTRIQDGFKLSTNVAVFIK
jgi:hypothetical protein